MAIETCWQWQTFEVFLIFETCPWCFNLNFKLVYSYDIRKGSRANLDMRLLFCFSYQLYITYLTILNPSCVQLSSTSSPGEKWRSTTIQNSHFKDAQLKVTFVSSTLCICGLEFFVVVVIHCRVSTH